MTAHSDEDDPARPVSSPPTERVIRILELLASDPERGFSLSEIARMLRISHGTCHAIVTTLAARQWIVRDRRSGSYSWGPALAALARPVNKQAFRPELQRLSDDVGMQVVLGTRQGPTVVVTDAVGESLAALQVSVGFRMPIVAPFCREFVAEAGPQVRKEWVGGLGSPSPRLRRRLGAVLDEVRNRGYAIERMSREYVRVYSALQALAAEGQPDEITARLASAFADLTVVDYLPGELDSTEHRVANVAAPIHDVDGTVTMSVGASPFATMTPAEVSDLGAAVRETATRIESLWVARADPPIEGVTP
ncbi:IclR family transcriptional regulator [Mycolicibacter senuensis]|uniref:Putative transcriptional regulator, IclR family protein n=1 Tax=Mycolicibacter senuensis TaxID=386913 RepID=A0A7I9XSR0_9MYCO|nr:helix-turn-helix domain-containing protein [Mycolicibacter senuensis]MDQ2627919.1 helix-turn-helix domain-containing protein [Actinomycetota bacterium]ORW64953.1 IclR family transcriptional regulator [Mycolicibacter senuensis]GFG72540.1 putative transcriptional regulator, IclR family protein [Mycolicibacter senuensis]